MKNVVIEDSIQAEQEEGLRETLIRLAALAGLPADSSKWVRLPFEFMWADGKHEAVLLLGSIVGIQIYQLQLILYVSPVEFGRALSTNGKEEVELVCFIFKEKNESNEDDPHWVAVTKFIGLKDDYELRGKMKFFDPAGPSISGSVAAGVTETFPVAVGPWSHKFAFEAPAGIQGKHWEKIRSYFQGTFQFRHPAIARRIHAVLNLLERSKNKPIELAFEYRRGDTISRMNQVLKNKSSRIVGAGKFLFLPRSDPTQLWIVKRKP